MAKVNKIHIIGGGVAGLSASYFARLHFPIAKIVVYEAGKKLGGRCQTFYSHKLGIEIDNATHVILGANTYAKNFWHDVSFIKKPTFCNVKQQNIDNKSFFHQDLLFRSVFNTAENDIAKLCKLNLAFKLFPYTPNKLQICYSQHNLQQNLITPLAQLGGEVKYNYLLREIKSENNQINKLIFSNDEIKLDDDEIVISALDSHNYRKIFGGNKFAYNRIVNIFYRTSQRITLPNNANMLGVEGGIFDWLFVTENTIGVTISNADKKLRCDEAFAVNIWKDICKIRNVKPAFIPAFQILDYPRATISQDDKNNSLRPNNAKGKYKNLYIAGDWTMKNWPCCIEGAISSALRAIKTI